MPETTFVKAVGRALSEAMAADENVIVLGEDVAEGGPYTTTAGLADASAATACINTPISEAAITGVAIGAAQSGLQPVLEIMFIDFITLALDNLVNQAAKAHLMSGGQLTVPMVLRTQGGAGQRGGAQHSQSLEAWLTHVPGLKVVMPSGAADAAGLMASAIADPGPVVFVEHKGLYFRREDVPDEIEPVPIGRARVAARGRRRDDRRPLAHGRRGFGGSGAARRGRDRGRGHRSPHTGAAGSGGDRRIGPAHQSPRGRPRGRRPRRGGRRDRGPRCSRPRSITWTRPSNGWARPSPRSR